MLHTIIITFVPVAFVILLGYLAGRRKVFGASERAVITRLVLSWLLPPLLLAGILKTPRADLLDYKIPLVFLVGLMGPYLVALLVCRYMYGYDKSTAALRASLMFFPDMVFMGIPILSQLFGPGSLYPILIANLVPTLLILPLTSVLLELGSKERQGVGGRLFLTILVRAICEPRVWAPFLGAVLVVLNVHIPQVVMISLDLIGHATTGLSLFVAGLIIAEKKLQFTLAVTSDVLFKNLIHPAVMFATVLAFGLTGELAKEAVLLAALPSAVITIMFAEQDGLLRSESSSVILGPRIASFATIPLVLALTRFL